mmetsp:Transcript_23974/g.61820  ORF Transcript_23974/g.61820 Transcript_23974/m.61820 type:complete len:203 (-) Transcript_23974:64-672(-)
MAGTPSSAPIADCVRASRWTSSSALREGFRPRMLGSGGWAEAMLLPSCAMPPTSAARAAAAAAATSRRRLGAGGGIPAAGAGCGGCTRSVGTPSASPAPVPPAPPRSGGRNALGSGGGSAGARTGAPNVSSFFKSASMDSERTERRYGCGGGRPRSADGTASSTASTSLGDSSLAESDAIAAATVVAVTVAPWTNAVLIGAA